MTLELNQQKAIMTASTTASIFAREEKIFDEKQMRIIRNVRDPWEYNPENGFESEAKKVISSRMQSYNGLANIIHSYAAILAYNSKSRTYEHANWCE